MACSRFVTVARRRLAVFGLVVAWSGFYWLNLSGHACLSALATGSQGLRCGIGDCEIVLTKVVTLAEGGPDGSLHGSAPLTVVQDPRGHFLVPTGDRRQVAVFTTTGTLITRLSLLDPSERAVALSASGDGPVLAWIFPAGRTLAINADLTVSAWPWLLPYLPAFIRADKAAIVAQQIHSPDLIGYPLHLVGVDGRVVRSFGTETPEYRADLRLLLERVAAPAADGSVWAAAPGRYVIERWNPATGAKVSGLPVRSDWFVESSSYPRDNRTRPKPVIRALWERDGLVWVLIQDADTAWKPGEELEQPLVPALRNALSDSVLEVIDPATARVIASERFPFVLFGRPPQALLGSYAFTPAGAPAGVDVWRPVLRRKERK